jgi:hypothetical protein
MRTQKIEAPPQCPQCGARVCLTRGAEGSAAFHCGSEHEDPKATCDWRMPITVETDIDQLVVTNELPGRVIR